MDGRNQTDNRNTDTVPLRSTGGRAPAITMPQPADVASWATYEPPLFRSRCRTLSAQREFGSNVK